jgi:metal-responsive CopG/Arc/MetJ family transcriptional regulator
VDEYKKGHIKDTVKYSYKENVDCKIEKDEKQYSKKVGAPKEIILLTPKCFKLFAMQSKSKKYCFQKEINRLEIEKNSKKNYFELSMNNYFFYVPLYFFNQKDPMFI